MAEQTLDPQLTSSRNAQTLQGQQHPEGRHGASHAGEQHAGERAGDQQSNSPRAEDADAASDSHNDGELEHPPTPGKPLGWLLTGAVVLLAALVATLAVARAVSNPRTDDAEVFANYIGIAPQVDGPISHIAVRDNQYVHAGDLLFEIDDRPYRYSLQRALSEQASLEGQIEDRERMIRSQQSAIHVAAAGVASQSSSTEAAASTVRESEAAVAEAQANVERARAERQYAEDNLHRLEPLLAQQYVTVDQVDRARTDLAMRSRAVDQALAALSLQQSRVASSTSRLQQSRAEIAQREAQREQAANAVETLDPLTGEREARAAAVRTAQYDLNNCRVYAPFDARVTNLTLSEGAYVHTGSQVFTLIDSRAWWVIANFRETQLGHVGPGSPADVFLMQRENLPLRGVVESIGYGVTPDPSVAGTVSPGLPAVQRSLSWVHLAARYPVRIRITAPPPDLLRIGQTAVAVVHPLAQAGAAH